MKSITKTMALCLLVFLSLTQTQTLAQNKLSTTQWQEDLKFLQQTVHDDYSFLFKKVTREKFDSEVNKLYQDIPNLADHQIMVGFARIVSLFEYGHTIMRLGSELIPYNKLPINLYSFNDGVYIGGTQIEHKTALGAKVLKIENTPIEEALKLVKPAFPAENAQFYKAYGMVYLTIPEVLHAQGVIPDYSQSVTLTLERDGKIFEHTFNSVNPGEVKTEYSLIKQEGDWLSTRNQDQTPLYLKHLDNIYFYEYLPEQKTVYVRQSQIQNDPSKDVPTFYGEVFDFIDQNNVERLVLDVRLNGGGNNYLNKPIITGIIQSKINKKGSFFVIIGRRTFSACQNLINELDSYTHAIFVGEPSGENINFYGDNRTVTLPNSNFPVLLSYAWWQDKPQWENGNWTAPHLPVDMSFEQYKNNQDPALDTALRFKDDANFIIDPMEFLTALFMQGKMEEVASEAARMVKDPMYKFYDFETQFNQAGENMIGGPQNQGAIFVLQLNSQLFPNSAKTWSNLASAYFASKDIEKARDYYKKAIDLDPDGVIGANARKKLATIAN